jgi:putative hydrolase of the HAD superfamily
MSAESTPASPKAFLFDLYGTLAPGGSASERDALARDIADLIQVDPDRLATLYRETFDSRMRGHTGDHRETLQSFAKLLGSCPTSESLERAVKLRLEFTGALLARAEGVPLLARLHRAGTRTGLVTDCSAETPTMWDESPLAPHIDSAAFSCRLGTRKPDPVIYQSVLAELNVQASDSVYVGDGESDELRGAESLGMRAILFDNTHDNGDSDAKRKWAGERISTLEELLVIV